MRNDKDEWNYEKIGAKGTETERKSEAMPAASTGKPGMAAPPLDIILSKLAITQGTMAMVDEKNKPLVKLDGINFSSAVSFRDGKLSGDGEAGIDKIGVANALFVEKAGTPVTFGTDQVNLSALSGRIANGALSGNVAVQYSGGFKYIVNLQVKDGDVATFLQEAGQKQVLTGRIKASVALQGTAGLPTIVGNGRAEIDNGQVTEIPLLNLLGTLLQIDVLRELKFTECVLEFSLSNNVMQTPVVRLVAPQVQIAGRGSVSLEDHSLNQNMTLTFARGVLDRTPGEIRGLFTEQTDGSSTLDFKVTGTYDSPKTDLTGRLIKGVGRQLLDKGLQQFLK
jgi:hypothetical protein